MNTSERQRTIQTIQTEERIADLLSRMKSIETQMLEKTEDIQQLADEIQVLMDLSGARKKLEAGARAVSTEPQPVDEADLERALDEMSQALRGPREVYTVEVATTRPYAVTCSTCGETIAFNDGHISGQMVGVHNC